MSYGAQPAQLDDDAGEDGYPSLADIARQETDGGRLVVRFLVDAMQGQLEDAKPCHRLDAARQLLKLGMDDARAYVADNGLAPSNRNASNNRNGHYQPAGSPRTNEPYPPLNQELADFIRLQTEGGKAAVRFLVDVMRGDLEGFKPHHRLSAAKELLRLCRDDHHDCDNDDDGGDDDDEEDEETYPHGLHKTLYDAYQDDEAKLGKKPSMQSTNYSPPTWRGEKQGPPPGTGPVTTTAMRRPIPATPSIRSTTPTRTTPMSSSKPSRERSRPTPDTRRERKQGPPSGPGATPSSGRLASAPPPGDPEPPPTPPAPATEEPGAGQDPPPQEPEEPRPAPTGPSHYERKAMSKGLDIWRDPADSWVSADVNPTGYQPSTRIDSTYFPRGP